MKTFKAYRLQGHVLGKTWGGGFATYPSKEVYGTSLDAAMAEARKLLASGGLDSGMGFEYLKGALLFVTETEYITIKGKTYNREEEQYAEVIGELTEEEQDLIMRQEYGV